MSGNIEKTKINFCQLAVNTNLNDSVSLNQSVQDEKKSFAFFESGKHERRLSFDTANVYCSELNDIDVIASAENIKKLLKMAYSSQDISIMIHRVNNTLLLDNSNIHAYLSKNAKKEWAWFKEFQVKELMSSERVRDGLAPCVEEANAALVSTQIQLNFLSQSLILKGDEDKGKEVVKDIPLPHVKNVKDIFTKNYIWNFENLKMLISSDLPIFGNNKSPAISLQLKDMREPINVLTGIDYWLDNLMCNVPDLAMCYHLDGFVKKYEFYKTEDLPNMDNCKFSSNVIKNLAKNLITFVKSNCIKSGHTYWLFKAGNDDFVKLYDLSSISSESCKHPGKTPFVLPVTYLLYKMFVNIRKKKKGIDDGVYPILKVLGEKCMETLNIYIQQCGQLFEEIIQMYASIAFYICDIYLPDSTDPFLCTDSLEYQCFESGAYNQSSGLDFEENSAPSDNTFWFTSIQKLKTKYEKKTKTKNNKEIAKTSLCFTERCYKSIKIACNALHLINKFYEEAASNDDIRSTNLQCEKWILSAKALFLHKISFSYAVLTNIALRKGKLGRALKFLAVAQRCYTTFCVGYFDDVKDIFPFELEYILLNLMELAGDAQTLLAKSESFDVNFEQFGYTLPLTERVLAIVESITHEVEHKWSYELSASQVKSLTIASICYNKAIDAATSLDNTLVLQRLCSKKANLKNETGLYYLYRAAAHASESNMKIDDICNTFIKKSNEAFEDSKTYFSQYKDSLNSAFVLCNQSKLLELKCQCCQSKDIEDLLISQLEINKKALLCALLAKKSTLVANIKEHMSTLHGRISESLKVKSDDDTSTETEDKRIQHLKSAITLIANNDDSSERKAYLSLDIATILLEKFRKSVDGEQLFQEANLYFTISYDFFSQNHFEIPAFITSVRKLNCLFIYCEKKAETKLKKDELKMKFLYKKVREIFLKVNENDVIKLSEQNRENFLKAIIELLDLTKINLQTSNQQIQNFAEEIKLILEECETTNIHSTVEKIQNFISEIR